MPDIGLFFASSTGNCETVARIIAKYFLPDKIDVHDVMHAQASSLKNYKFLIFGIPTWNKHTLHEDWDDFLKDVKPDMLKNKVIALYGSADQHSYPDNFADSMGMLFFWLEGLSAKIIGSWPVEGYSFRRSMALHKGKFVGLVLDEDAQPHLTSDRIKKWVENLKTEFTK
jgi:flavodoxin I